MRLERFINKFNSSTSLSDKHKQMLSSFEIDAASLGLLANAFVKSGDFDKAIGVYLIALNKAADQNEREWVLTELGSAYFRAGFLVRAADVFKEALRLRARNLTALRLFVVVLERLRRFDEALEALGALEELGSDVRQARAYIKALMILNDKDKSLSERINTAKSLCGEFKLLDRMCMQAYKQENGTLSGFSSFARLPDVLDIIFYENEPLNLNDSEYAALFYAKAKIEPNEAILKALDKMSFEIRSLALLNQNKANRASLSFGYVCHSCKSNLPMHFYRCPVCHELNSCLITSHLTEKSDENSMPF